MCFGTRKVANYAKRPLILTLAGGTVSFASAIAQEPDDQPIIRMSPAKSKFQNSRCSEVPREASGDNTGIESSHREDLLGLFGVVITRALDH